MNVINYIIIRPGQSKIVSLGLSEKQLDVGGTETHFLYVKKNIQLMLK